MANPKTEQTDIDYKYHNPALISLNERVELVLNAFILFRGKVQGSKEIYLGVKSIYQKNSIYLGNDKKYILQQLNKVENALGDKNYLIDVNNYNNQTIKKNNSDLNKILTFENKLVKVLDEVFNLMCEHFAEGNLFPKQERRNIDLQEKRDKGVTL